jgi:hypothetical protein
MRSLDSYSFNNSMLKGSFMRMLDLPKEVHGEKVKVSFQKRHLGGKITQDRRSDGEGSQSQNRLTRGRVLGGSDSRGGEDVHSDADTAG